MALKSKKIGKAYENEEFIKCSEGRVLRLLSEYLEPLSRFKKMNIKNTIVFFGSARSPSKDRLTAMLEASDISSDRHQTLLKLSRHRQDAVDLSYKLTQWAMTINHGSRIVVCSGGGPGIMEAANEGAALAGGKSIGLNVSLPMEQECNPFITDELNFEFHYFFMRKFWFAYLAKALIVFPGGFGTMDELFEILTLIQTQKLQKRLAVVIYGTEYWKQILNFDKMVEWGTIDKLDLELFHFSDTPQDAFNYITGYLEKHYLSCDLPGDFF